MQEIRGQLIENFFYLLFLPEQRYGELSTWDAFAVAERLDGRLIVGRDLGAAGERPRWCPGA